MTPAQIDLARHALGLPTPSRRSYRNRYFTSEGGVVFEEWMAMAAAGEAQRFQPRGVKRPGAACFELTHKGALAALKAGETLCPEDFPAESAL